ncbi:MAG: hypothetical protein ACYCSN_06990 [Acidobacteriaceae bacterium]
MWDLGRKTAQFFKRPIDLAVRLSALRRIQFHRGARQTPVGAPRHGYDYFQIAIQFHHGRRGRIHCMFALRLQKQLRLIQKPLANRNCRSSPGGI